MFEGNYVFFGGEQINNLKTMQVLPFIHRFVKKVREKVLDKNQVELFS